MLEADSIMKINVNIIHQLWLSDLCIFFFSCTVLSIEASNDAIDSL